MNLRPLGVLAPAVIMLIVVGSTFDRAIEESNKMEAAANESGYWRAENQLHSVLDSEFNRKIVADELADGDKFTKLSSIIDSAEPPIIRPVIWDKITDTLRLSGKTTLEAIGEVLDRFKLPALK